jgi:uncharacterized damage-inducible protein DinB
MTTSVVLVLLHHKTWATLRLIEYCQSLAAEHLEATLPGTFGTIRATLHHLVLSDEGYVRNLTGETFGPTPADIDLATLSERFRALSERWEVLVQDPLLPDREFTSGQGTFKSVACLAQSIHHADDHRTQVLSILGARGLQVPDLDVWDYATEAGYGHYPD